MLGSETFGFCSEKIKYVVESSAEKGEAELCAVCGRMVGKLASSSGGKRPPEIESVDAGMRTAPTHRVRRVSWLRRGLVDVAPLLAGA